MNILAKSNKIFNVFVTPNRQYVAVRNISLAFGNTAKEIYLVDDLIYAEQFWSHITELKSKDFYHKFPDVLEHIISKLKVKQVVSKTEYYFTEDALTGESK